MTDRNPAAGNPGDEPTARQPAAQPEPVTKEQPAVAATPAGPPPAAESQPAPSPAAESQPAPEPPPAAQPAAAQPAVAQAAPPPAVAPRRPWQSRRVPLLAAGAMLLAGCLLGGCIVAAGAAIVEFADRRGDHRVIQNDRDGGRFGERGPNDGRGPVRIPNGSRPGFDGRNRDGIVPAPSTTPTAPVPSASS